MNWEIFWDKDASWFVDNASLIAELLELCYKWQIEEISIWDLEDTLRILLPKFGVELEEREEI